MQLVNKEIESWIEPYATIVGSGVTIDKSLRESNPPKYFISLTLPDIFEAYAIALASYWIYDGLSEDEILPYNHHNEPDIPEEKYKRVKWKDFYKTKGLDFEINNAIEKSIFHRLPFTQMNNELWCGEGVMDNEHIKSFIECILFLYGNQEIEALYIYLSTNNWTKSRLYQGQISELPELLENPDLRLTPSLIYPKEKNWALNTDYDLPFTTIGGESRLIDLLVKKNKDEIYRII